MTKLTIAPITIQKPTLNLIVYKEPPTNLNTLETNTNGLIEYIGNLTGTFIDPCTTYFNCQQSSRYQDSTFSSKANAWFDKKADQSNALVTGVSWNNPTGSWASFTLNNKWGINLTAYALQNRDPAFQNNLTFGSPLNWKLQGSISNTFINWEDIDIKNNQSAWAVFETRIFAVNTTQIYKAFRLITNGNHSETVFLANNGTPGHFMLIMGEIELYGRLYELN